MTDFQAGRRRFLAGAGALALAGCNPGCDPGGPAAGGGTGDMLRLAEGLTMASQRNLLGRTALAREYTDADISPRFRVNGTSMPDSDTYADLLENGFADWRLQIGGLVARPQSFSLAQLKLLPSRTQITRHDCVEGWSAIGKWTGVPLGFLLGAAGVMPSARYVVFHCADELERTLDGSGRYYESIDMVDAFHPQTILAHGMNGADLGVGHGAPLRLRVERQLGYKHAKYLMRIELVESFRDLWGGNGGYWEDRGYDWYAGI